MNAISSSNALTKRGESQISCAKLSEKYPTIQHFSQAYSAATVHAAGLAPKRCVLNESSPTISMIRKTWGEGPTQAWLLELFSQWQEVMPIKTKMPTFQLHMLAATICTDFHWLRASEILLFLARLSGGAYQVDWYSVVSPDIIIKALVNNFLPERERILESKPKDPPPPHHPITWEEYCERHGIDKPNPLETLTK